MNKPTPTKAFNLACAEYMNWKYRGFPIQETDSIRLDYLPHNGMFREFHPYDDMNQLLPVADKLLEEVDSTEHKFFAWVKTCGHITDGEKKLEKALIDFVSQALNIEATN